MVECWKIYFIIVFIGLGVMLISMVVVKIDVFVWVFIVGYCGVIIVGFICVEFGRGVN